MAGTALRPTPDRLREALFNVLAPRIEGVTFLDAYAGSGSVGIEALSRGAREVFFIDEIPRTPNDKFDRRALADRAVELSQGGRR